LNSLRNNLPKKIKVAIGATFEDFGGVARYIHEIRKFSSYDVTEIPSQRLVDFLSRAFLSYRMTSGKKDNPYDILMENIDLRRIYQRFMKTVRLNGYDIAHSQSNKWFTNACLNSRNNLSGWIHTYHSLYAFEEDFPQGLMKWQINANKELLEIAPKADVRISVSHWLHDYLEEKYDIQTIVIPNGVDIDACNVARSQDFIERYRIKDFILFVGYISEVKNPSLFIELASMMPEKKFVMIGRGLQQESLKTVYDGSLPSNIIPLGELNHSDTLNAMSASKILVMTSKREGLPTVLLEAMSLGKPTVAPAHTGCKEVIHDDRFGFLFEPDSLDDLEKKTRIALESSAVGENARERVRMNYNMKTLVSKIDDIYASLM